ncbi:unnamed protein product [Paramecium octaurelia]|uniref:Transmembrane protein n=1 Tax=Paramecium octaurelia TaxID=43137 RepID=A0A8S1WW06_PAROT|nr:unnamed protein product [Paramecium octaurelia]
MSQKKTNSQSKLESKELRQKTYVQKERKREKEEVPLQSIIKNADPLPVAQEQKAQFSISRCFQSSPDPRLDWEIHTEKISISEFKELIENRFNEVKRSSSIHKYYAKIGFQVLIYCLNILELIFTLSYDSYNQILDEDSYYGFCYNLSIILCILLHSGVWMYTYKFKEVAKQSFVVEIAYYIFYMLMGALSYLKLAPFIYFFNRDQSIRQFSFSEINKYLQLSGEDKLRNPCVLFKKRTKPVNIFRDLIFHRVALLSMMITMTIQTIPQLFIQGFYNTEKGLWDGFNVLSYLLLLSNLIYYFSELQFIVFTTTYRQIQTDLSIKLQKIKLKLIQETKQLLKSDQKYMGFIQSFYFHIDPTNFSPYQKKRCMIQIISSLIIQKKLKNIEFHFIDIYEEITLQYLANCLKFINVEKISLLYQDQSRLLFLQGIFQNVPNITFSHQTIDNLDELWTNDKIDLNAQGKEVRQIQFIENPKITSGWQLVQHNQFIQNNFIQPSQEFIALIPVNLRGSSIPFIINQQSQIIDQTPQEQLETPQQIINDARFLIDNLTKRALFQESIGNIQFLLKLYDFYETWSKLNGYQATIQTIWSLLNGSLQVVSLFYLSNEGDMFISALIVLTAVNPILQMLSYAVFQHRVFRNYTILRQLTYILLFATFNFLKIWDIIMICLYIGVNEFAQDVQRTFSSEGYFKFKSYASKFKGSIATTVFQYKSVAVDCTNILQIKNQPFYEAVMWRTNVEEALNKIPQFFVYILSLSSQQIDKIWILAFFQQIKESIQAIKDILEVVIKDYFIPALILSKISVDQFFQSMQYLSSISNQILLEYPKSFQIVSKVDEIYLREKFTFKINVKSLNFSNYADLKKQKMLAQFRYVLAQITTVLEIDQAQRLFCMGPELHDLIKCLKVSPLYQLKLNYYLDEVDPSHIPYINVFIKSCPRQLQFLQLYVESRDTRQLEVFVERIGVLTAFSYSYFQIIPQYRNNTVVAAQQILNIDNTFLKLDRYNFEQFYFEVSGNLNLDNCHQLLEQFSGLKVFKASIVNNAQIQTFYFQKNLKSQNMEILDITFENIRLEFGEQPFQNLTTLKIVLRRCEFNKEKLKQILGQLNNANVVYIDMSECLSRFTVQEQKNLVRQLEIQRIDVVIKI